MKRWFSFSALTAILAILLFHCAAPSMRAQTTPNQATVLWVYCGGEDEAPCPQLPTFSGWDLLPPTPSDYTAIGENPQDKLRCDVGLQIHQNSDGSLACVNLLRLTVGETTSPLNPAWTFFARHNQSGTIQADTPLPFAPVLGTHNSYSNYFDGTASPVSADQGLSVTDQLQYGARTIRLDPWLFTNTDNQIRLCHMSENLGGISTCTETDQTGKALSLNRPFIFAVKEIAHWLKQHPGEFIMLRLHDSAQGWGGAGTLNGALEHDGTTPPAQVSIPGTNYFCWALAQEFGSMIYKNKQWDTGSDGPSNQCTGTSDIGIAVPDDSRFPTLRQLRAMNKQIIVVSEFASEWTFEDANGQLGYGPSTQGLAAFQFDVMGNPAIGTQGTAVAPFSGVCIPGITPQSAFPTSFLGVGEDRSVSQLLANIGNQYLAFHKTADFLDAPTVQSALACGATWLEADFLGSLGSAPDFIDFVGVNARCDDYTASGCSTVDTRRESMIWSWANQPDAGTPGEPALMTTGAGHAFGSWVSRNPGLTAPYLCASLTALQAFYNGHAPESQIRWSVTKTTGTWQNGETACQTEKGSDWHFWRPGSAIQNAIAWDTLNASGETSVWLNHANTPIQALPAIITLTPSSPSQSFVISGGLGGKLIVGPTDGSIQVESVPFYSPLDQFDSSNDNNSTIFTVSLTSHAAGLLPRPGPLTFQINEEAVLMAVNPSSNLLNSEPQQTTLATGGQTTVTVNIQIPQPPQ
jgi:hypothetical protein